jgi:hypothetical protein
VIFIANYIAGEKQPFTCRIEFCLFDCNTGEMKPVDPWDIVAP